MNLPVLNTPKYNLRLPSTGSVIEYRPFLVKEEKIMLLAQESESQTQIIGAIKDVLSACTFGKLDIDSIASFDLEYLFLKIRAKSVGEDVEIGIPCSSCNGTVKISLNLDDVEVVGSIPKESRVELADGIGVNLRPITVKELTRLTSDSKTEIDTSTDSIIALIESVYDTQKIYPKENSSHAELTEFVNSFSRVQLQKIENYISQLPRVEHTVSYTCPHCGHKDTVTLSGLQSFFA